MMWYYGKKKMIPTKENLKNSVRITESGCDFVEYFVEYFTTCGILLRLKCAYLAKLAKAETL